MAIHVLTKEREVGQLPHLESSLGNAHVSSTGKPVQDLSEPNSVAVISIPIFP